MKCPKCRTVDLQPVQTAAPVFHLDTCPQCRGVWFDGSELEGTLGKAGQPVPVPRYAFEGKDTLCPRCQVNLHEYCYPKTTVLVDGCKQCHGLWLDQGEWPQIKASLSTPASAPDITCPKCNTPQAAGETCVHCGLIFQKYQQQAAQRLADTQDAAARVSALFKEALGFQIKQQLEWFEILSPFEIRNRYEVIIRATRNRFGVVQEQSRSFFNLIGRQLLGSLRPATLIFEDDQDTPVLMLQKRFRFYFHRMEVADAYGQPIGSIERRFHLLRHNYDITDPRGRRLMAVRGPLFFLPFSDYTFRFIKGEQEVGRVKKRWRGLLREAFTDADAFLCRVDPDLSEPEKILLFGAAFLIDFGCFENNQGSGSSLADLGN